MAQAAVNKFVKRTLLASRLLQKRYEYKGSEEWQALTGTQTVEPRKKPHQEYLASCAKIRKEITSLEYTTLISPLRTMSSVTTICRSLLLRTRWLLFIGSKIIMSSIIVPKSWDWSENERRCTGQAQVDTFN